MSNNLDQNIVVELIHLKEEHFVQVIAELDELFRVIEVFDVLRVEDIENFKFVQFIVSDVT